MMTCQFIKENGETCKARTISGSGFCFFHNPESKQNHLVAVRTGGLNSKKNDVIMPKRAIRKSQDVISVIEETLNLLRAGEIHPNYSNSIFIGCNTLLKALEQTDIYNRLKDLEQRIL